MVQTTIDSLRAENLMGHLRALCTDIGPRPSTSREERRAAEYVRQVLEDLTVDAIQDQFFVSHDTSGWLTIPPLTLTALAPLLSGRLGKLLGGVGLIWAARMLYETARTRAPFYQPMIAQAASQNVHARLQPAGAIKRRVYLIGHLDSNKQRFMMPLPVRGATKAFNTTGIVLALLSGALMIGEAVTGRRRAGRLQNLTGLVGAAALLSALYDEAQPYIEGANDNASAVAVLLGVAAALKGQPLQHTEVNLLFTGCEEVGCVGIHEFIRQNQPPRQDTYFIDLEMVGTGRLGYASKHGLTAVTEYRPGPRITALAQQVARANPDLRVNGKDMLMVEEVAALRQHGYEAICLVGYDDQGFLANWHRTSDTLANIEPDTLSRAARYTHALIQAIDRLD